MCSPPERFRDGSQTLPPPKIRKHSANGQAYVREQGKFTYLGKWGSPESLEAYDQFCLDWYRRNDASGKRTITWGTVAVAFIKHAESFYVHPDGRPTGETANFRAALRPLLKMFRHTPVAEFGPERLVAVQQELIKLHVRTQANKNVARIKAVVKWAASRGMIPPETFTNLQCVSGLRAGRSEARESDPVEAISLEDVNATVAHLTPTVAAMVKLQLLTASRPSEIRLMQVSQIDRSKEVWRYTPKSHKNAWRGKSRFIFIGPKGQRVLQSFLEGKAGDDYVFRPHDGREAYVRKNYRKGAAVSVRNAETVNKPYSLHGYISSIHKACDKAKIKRWSPNRLRHSAADIVNVTYGDLDAARVYLGHAESATTRIYAARDEAKAAAIAAEIG